MSNVLINEILQEYEDNSNLLYEDEKQLEQQVVFLHYCGNTLANILGYYPRYYPEHAGLEIIKEKEYFYSLHVEPLFYALWNCIELYNGCFYKDRKDVYRDYILPCENGKIVKGEAAYAAVLNLLGKQSPSEILSFISYCHMLMEEKRVPFFNICVPLLEGKNDISIICSKLYKHMLSCYPALCSMQVKFCLNHQLSVPPVL